MKKNNERKDKIKKTALKILHVVSYVLSFGFIIVCILVGVGSCNNKKSHDPQRQERQIQERVNIDDKYNYFFQSKLDFPINYTDYDDTTLELNLTSDCVLVLSNSNEYGVSIQIGNSIVIYDNGVSYENYYDFIKVDYNWYAPGQTLYLFYVYLYNSSTGDILFLYNRGTNNYSNIKFYCDSLDYEGNEHFVYTTFDVENFLSLYFYHYKNEDLSYFFDVNTLNPIEYYTYEVTAYNLVHNVGSYTGRITLDMVFISNNNLYDKLRFQYDYVLGCYVDGDLYTFNDMTYLGLTNIQYHNVLTDEWQIVCYPRIYRYETRTINNVSNLYGYPITDFKTYLWANEGYKNIEIVSGSKNVWSTLSADPLAYLTNWQILNYKGTYNNVYVGGNSNTNVFVLLGNAFKSVGGLFAIGLLPGITIGTLLFLPLVVLIIFAIIKIIHK